MVKGQDTLSQGIAKQVETSKAKPSGCIEKSGLIQKQENTFI